MDLKTVVLCVRETARRNKRDEYQDSSGVSWEIERERNLGETLVVSSHHIAAPRMATSILQHPCFILMLPNARYTISFAILKCSYSGDSMPAAFPPFALDVTHIRSEPFHMRTRSRERI
jgi:hypothetical protein